MSYPLDRQGRAIPDGSWPPGKTAPPPLEEVRRFVNTTNRENGAELLDSPDGLDEWLVGEGRSPVRTDAGGLHRLVALREALRDLATANHDAGGDDTAWSRFQAVVADAPLVVVERSGKVTLGAASPGVEGLLADIAATVVLAAAAGTWKRMKACSNQRCRWLFWDRTRSRTGAWCSMSACGQRVKQREYRRRQARRR